MIELTKAEEKWIKEFKAVAKRCPKTLWLSNNGSMTILKVGDGGEKVKTPNEGINQDYIVDHVPGIHSDGGDW